MSHSMPTGWVTYQKIPLHDGRVLLIQKNDGKTRTILGTQTRRP
jgi:hypothetical protein